MTDHSDLKPGSFYWVKPVWDVDLTPPGFEGQEYSDKMFEAMSEDWRQKEQPARFSGYSANGDEQWQFIGQDDDEENWWPVCWIGPEITLS
jgi:hypothetical protein